MESLMEFKEWLERQGCTVEVTQEEEGNGYVVLEVHLPYGNGVPGSDRSYSITVVV
jgi:hypothetical protein